MTDSPTLEPSPVSISKTTTIFFLFTVRSVIIYNILAEKFQTLFGGMNLAVTNFPTLAVHIKNLEPRSETDSLQAVI